MKSHTWPSATSYNVHQSANSNANLSSPAGEVFPLVTNRMTVHHDRHNMSTQSARDSRAIHLTSSKSTAAPSSSPNPKGSEASRWIRQLTSGICFSDRVKEVSSGTLRLPSGWISGLNSTRVRARDRSTRIYGIWLGNW